MKHRKQFHDLLERTIAWNNIRGNTPDTLNWGLELAMLQEELDELASAHHRVDQFDALLDLMFVTLGSLGKMGLTPEQIVDGYEAVMLANESKSSTKNSNGKITKPLGFVGPEASLQTILERS